MDSWSLLGAVPVLGVLTHLGAGGRKAAVATVLIAIGGVRLVFWVAALASGILSASRADVPWAIGILLFPCAAT